MVLGNWYTRAGDNIKRPEILRESTWRFESSPYYNTNLNIINMIKLKRLTVDKIDPSINQKGQIEFSFNDCYLRKDQIGGVVIINNEPLITSNWVQKEIGKYCINNNLQLCTIATISNMPDFSNIVVDETIKELLKSL